MNECRRFNEKLNNEKSVAERKAFHDKAKEFYNNAGKEFAILREKYNNEDNYIDLYDFSNKCLNGIGCMAEEILKVFDKGLATNIPQAVQYLDAKEQNDALIRAHERTQAVTAAAASVNAAAAQVNAEASRVAAAAQQEAASKIESAKSGIKSSLDSIEQHLKI